jgi:hypothetical protein
MWPTTFAERLDSWNLLRAQCQNIPIESALDAVNQWWFNAPWRAYHLHWDDQQDWPDPWELLSDNIYCDLARGLGILYTITLLDRADIDDAMLVLTKNGYNLVLVAKEKYILNWDRDTVVNTNQEDEIVKQVHQHLVRQKYN